MLVLPHILRRKLVLRRRPYKTGKRNKYVILNGRASLSEHSEESACLFRYMPKVKSRSFDFARASLRSR
jgi:hypothetical protein